MSSILTAGSSTPAFISDGFNEFGGLTIIGKDDEPNKIIIEEDGSPDLGDDIISAGSQNDFVSTSSGDDLISTGSGADVIFAGDGSDIVRSGSGMDIVSGGKGGDYVFGGEGMDVFDLKAEDFAAGEIDRYLDFEDSHTDMLRISGVSDPVTYDAATGEVKVGDDTVAFIGKDLDVEVTKLDEDTYDLF